MYRRLSLAVVGTVVTVAGLSATIHDQAHGSDVPRNVPVECTMHIDGDGNASLGHCHRVHPRLAWMNRTCTQARPVNCFMPGGPHRRASYVRFWDGNTCQFYVGPNRVTHRFDYCA